VRVGRASLALTSFFVDTAPLPIQLVEEQDKTDETNSIAQNSEHYSGTSTKTSLRTYADGVSDE
jgi:hypothetical protein